MFIVAIVVLLVTCSHSKYDKEHGAHQFEPGNPIVQLSNDDFDNITLIGKPNQSHAWFIMFYAHWSQPSLDMIPFWIEVAEKFNGQIKFGAIECHENEDIRDRFEIPLFPSFMYFSMDGEMHKFIGYRTMANVTEWIHGQRWKSRAAEFTEIPESIHPRSYFKRFIRRIFHPIALIAYLVFFVVSVIAFCVWDSKTHAKKMEEARRIKLELIRRKQEKDAMVVTQDFKAKID